MRHSFRPETSGTLDELSERRYSGEVESTNDLQDDFISAKYSTRASYHSHLSHSSTYVDEQDVMSNQKEEEEDVAENPFADFDEENFQKDNKSAIESTAVAFDDYGSDGDDYGFDLDKGAEPSVKTSQPSWESPSYPSASISSPSPKRTTVDTFTKITPQSSFSTSQHGPIFSGDLADSTVHSLADELAPVTFDESDGPSSESEVEQSDYKEERVYSSFGSQKKFGIGDLPSSSGKYSLNSKNKGLDTSDDPVDKKHQSQPFNAYEDTLVHEVEESASVFSERGTIDDSKSSHEDSYDSDLGLTFGRLTGGLKNKDDSVVQQEPESVEVGSRGPAFTSFGSGSDQIPEKTVSQDNSRSHRERQVQKVEQKRTSQGQISDSHPESYPQQESEVNETERSSSRGSSASFELREEQRGSRTRRERYIEKMQPEVDDNLTRRASTRPVIPSLVSDGIYAPEGTMKEQIYNSGSEPYTQEESEVNKRSGSTGSSTNSRERIGAGLSKDKGRSSLRSSYPTETSTRPHSAADEAYSLRSSEQSRYSKEAKGEPISETKRSSREETSKSTAMEQPSSSISKKTSSSKSGMSEDRPKPTAREQPSLPIRKKVSSAKSGMSESSKAATPSLESASREDSFNRASHVHPKLPDYDTFAATMQSLELIGSNSFGLSLWIWYIHVGHFCAWF
ncbi:protein lingerer-like [Eucalyptus grandis]|uniref:protein lingerer-like n=1 Tax=Eucalyptus grandis TaxID=71139 RepID=UPI00192EAB51|nr:protein lingerer-like [Eucalyptus grandis]